MEDTNSQTRKDTVEKETNAEWGRGLLVCFPRLCIRKAVFFTPWPPHSPFLGKSETKSREAAAGREQRTGKLALGRRKGGRGAGIEEPTQHDWQKEAVIFVKAHWNTCTGRRTRNMKHTRMQISFLVSRHLCPLRSSKNVLSVGYFGCKLSWNAELMPGSSTTQPASAVNPILWLLCYAC